MLSLMCTPFHRGLESYWPIIEIHTKYSEPNDTPQNNAKLTTKRKNVIKLKLIIQFLKYIQNFTTFPGILFGSSRSHGSIVAFSHDISKYLRNSAVKLLTGYPLE